MVTNLISVEDPSTAKITISATHCHVCGCHTLDTWLRAPDRFYGRTEVYELARCPNCSLVWVKNAPLMEGILSHYGTDYDGVVSDAGKSTERWTWRRDVLQKYKSGGAVLDIGCSAGGFLEAMRLSGWGVAGIEMSPRTAEIAAKRSGADIFVGDVLDAPFEAESFDAVTCFHLLEHVYRPRQVLARISNWLKPGGILYLMVPNIDSAGARVFGSYWSVLDLPRHLFHFSPRSLRLSTQSVGLQEVSLTTEREFFLEDSLRFCFDQLFRSIGLHPKPAVRKQKARLPWRILRKSLRMSVFPAMMAIISLAGDGECIHAMFRKSGPYQATQSDANWK